MAEMIKLTDGSLHPVLGLKDMMELVDAYMGDEAHRWLTEYIQELEEITDSEVS